MKPALGAPQPGLTGRGWGRAQGPEQLLTLGTAVCARRVALSRGWVHAPSAGLRHLQPGKRSCLRQGQGQGQDDLQYTDQWADVRNVPSKTTEDGSPHMITTHAWGPQLPCSRDLTDFHRALESPAGQALVLLSSPCQGQETQGQGHLLLGTRAVKIPAQALSLGAFTVLNRYNHGRALPGVDPSHRGVAT